MGRDVPPGPFCGQDCRAGRSSIAKRADAGLLAQHRSAKVDPVTRPSKSGLRNLADVIAFHEAKGRLHSPGGKTPRERALGAWLYRRRREVAAGALSPPTETPVSPFLTGISSRRARLTTRHAGSSGWKSSVNSGPPAGHGSECSRNHSLARSSSVSHQGFGSPLPFRALRPRHSSVTLKYPWTIATPKRSPKNTMTRPKERIRLWSPPPLPARMPHSRLGLAEPWSMHSPTWTVGHRRRDDGSGGAHHVA